MLKTLRADIPYEAAMRAWCEAALDDFAVRERKACEELLEASRVGAEAHQPNPKMAARWAARARREALAGASADRVHLGPTGKALASSLEVVGVADYGDIAAGLTDAGFEGKHWSYSAVYKRIRGTRGDPQGVFKQFRQVQIPNGKFRRGKVTLIINKITERSKAEAEAERKRAENTKRRKAEEARTAEALGTR